MSTNQSRFLIELDKVRREINREVISPRIPELSLDVLQPTLRAVAHARAEYALAFLHAADNADPVPPEEMILDLEKKRKAYDELVLAANALEQIIQRDYIDVVLPPKQRPTD